MDGRLDLVIMPTGACQLSCSYCGQRHTGSHLRKDVLDEFCKFINSRLETDRIDRLRVMWYGGEPTLAKVRILESTDAFKNVVNPFDVTYTAEMVTNGVALTPALAVELLAADVRSYQITLDGPPQVHDSRRATRDGRGTFLTILENLTGIAQASDLKKVGIAVRVNVDMSSAAHVPDLIRLLAENGLAGRIGLYFSPVVPWTGHGSTESSHPNERERIAAMEVDWLLLMRDLGFQLPPLPGPRWSACAATSGTAFIIAPDGDVHNCLATPLSPASENASTGFLGHLNDTPFYDRFRRCEAYDNLLKKSRCRRCEFLPLCRGACPNEAGHGRLPCPTFRWNIGSRIAIDLAERLQ